jgi:hypothetical protein
MARSYQIGSQRLKLNAVGHVLLAFLGVFGLLSLSSNYRMSLIIQINQLPTMIWC